MDTREVSLEKEEGLEVRRLEVGVVEFDRDAVVDALEKSVFVASDGDRFELGG